MRKIYTILIIFLITVFLFSLTLELAYRYQWLDFYKPELLGLNTKEILHSDKKKILICGDSFSADPNSYVKSLRDSLTEYAVINGAVPGTGILQHELYIKNRIEEISPDIFIYQFYVGNDLFDISHPHASDKISRLRSGYWWLSDKMLSLAFLNYRFAGVRYSFYDDGGGSYNPKEKDTFSIENYSKREKLNYLADPSLMENTLILKGGREKDYALFEEKLSGIIGMLPAKTKSYFVIIPHQSQISEEYFSRHQKMGSFSSIPYYNLDEYSLPLYIKLKELCRNNKIAVIDPLEKFKSYEHKEDLYFSNDPHLRIAGHQIISEMLLNAMDESVQPQQP